MHRGTEQKSSWHVKSARSNHHRGSWQLLPLVRRCDMIWSSNSRCRAARKLQALRRSGVERVMLTFMPTADPVQSRHKIGGRTCLHMLHPLWYNDMIRSLKPNHCLLQQSAAFLVQQAAASLRVSTAFHGHPFPGSIIRCLPPPGNPSARGSPPWYLWRGLPRVPSQQSRR